MAMADSSQNHQDTGVDTINSPQNRKNLLSPWARVVRGERDSIHVPPPQPQQEQSTFSDCFSSVKTTSPPPLQNDNSESTENNNGNAGTPKKQAWKKPIANGLTTEIVASPVMGAVSWPALSESTNKASPKSSTPPPPPPDSPIPKIVSDGSSSVPTLQGPVIPNSPQKQVSNNNAKPTATSNHTMPVRQRSFKRGGVGGSSSSGGAHSQGNFAHPQQPPPPSPPPYPMFAMPLNGFGNPVPVMPDQFPRGNNWEPRPIVGGFAPQPPAVNDFRHSSRRGNFGTRGDGSYRNNFSSKRDQDRGHYGNGSDTPAQPQRSPRSFTRPPPQNTPPFVPSQPARPFANTMSFPGFMYLPAVPLEPFRGVPFIAHGPASPVMMPVPEPSLSELLVRQIEFYFSDANLVKDDFLKSNMDDQGWVPITLIASFNRVKRMTNDIHIILDSLMASTVLEVQDDKVRKRNDWMQWIPSSNRLPTDSRLQSFSASSHDLLRNSFEKMTVEEVTANQDSMAVKSSYNSEDAIGSSSELTAQSVISQGEKGTEDARSS